MSLMPNTKKGRDSMACKTAPKKKAPKKSGKKKPC